MNLYLLRWLERQSKAYVLALAYLLLPPLVALDYRVGPDLEVPLLYLVPIGMATWFAGSRAGLVMIVLATGVQALTDLDPGRAGSLLLVRLGNIAISLAVFLLVSRILLALHAAYEQERELARTDSLTGAANARAFWEFAEREIQRCRRYRRPYTLAYLDLDNFKQVNDHLGHAAGDLLLRQVVRAIGGAIRRSDLLARLGGDEFAIWLPETSGEAAYIVVEKVRRAILATCGANGWPVSASIGVVICTRASDSLEAVLALADQMLYAAKRLGRNQAQYAQRPNGCSLPPGRNGRAARRAPNAKHATILHGI